MSNLSQPAGAEFERQEAIRALASWLAAPLLFLVGFLFFRMSLTGYFLADDFAYIRFYGAKRLSEFPAGFFENSAPGIWGVNPGELRPVRGLTYWLDFQLWGANPYGYHLSNLIIYLLATAGLYLLLREINHSLWESAADREGILAAASAALGAAVFLLHPSHAETIVWITGRVDSLAALFYFFALYCLVRFWNTGKAGWLLAGDAILVAGLFTKETVVTLPVVYLFFALLTPRFEGWRKRWLVAAVAVAIPLSFWIVLRRLLTGNVFRYESAGQVLHFFRGFSFSAGQILWIPLEIAPFVLGLLVLGCLRYAVAKWTQGGRAVLFWGVVWPVLQFLPLISAPYLSSRHVFLATTGPAALASLLAFGTLRARRRVGWYAVSACLAVVILLAVPVKQELRFWKESGDYSRRLSMALEQGAYSQEDVVVIAPHHPVWAVWFWHWALPYAAQPPFLNLSARIVEPPEWYCCPDWLERVRPVMEAVASGQAPYLHRIDFYGPDGDFEDHLVENPFPTGKLEITTRADAIRWIQKVREARIIE